MILGLEDIPGGTGIVSFLIWLALSALFYLVCYVAALNVIDDLTQNSVLKIPAMLGAAVPAAGLMAILHYKPLILIIVTAVANYFRVNALGKPGSKKFAGMAINKPLFFLASYGYLLLVLILALYFQSEAFQKALNP